MDITQTSGFAQLIDSVITHHREELATCGRCFCVIDITRASVGEIQSHLDKREDETMRNMKIRCKFDADCKRAFLRYDQAHTIPVVVITTAPSPFTRLMVRHLPWVKLQEHRPICARCGSTDIVTKSDSKGDCATGCATCTRDAVRIQQAIRRALLRRKRLRVSSLVSMDQRFADEPAELFEVSNTLCSQAVDFVLLFSYLT